MRKRREYVRRYPERVSAGLGTEEFRELERIAAERGTSLSQIVRQFVLEGLEREAVARA